MKTSRRRFLTKLGATASFTLLSPSLFDFKLLAGSPFVRSDVGPMTATDPILTGYSTAIAAMQGLPANDVRNWTYQAGIHYGSTAPMADWNMCQHGTHFFWAWHRMYLYWWERIVRKYSGNPNWALPYWNWTANQKLPAPFRVVTSSLYTPNRDPNMNNGTGSLPATDVAYKLPLSSDFSNLDYYSAQSGIELSPHNVIHGDVGGFSGWMSYIDMAAQDPIFYLHHANIDRLWDLWLAQGGGRSDPTSDSTWTGQIYNFYDENGATVSMTPCDILNAAAQLNYQYEGEPAQVTQSCGTIPIWLFRYIILLVVPFPTSPIGPDPYTVQMNLANLPGLPTILSNPLKQVLLELDGVQTQQPPGATWEVYVGLPAGVGPDPSSPFYVGKMGLFGRGVKSGSRNFQTATFRFNATNALKAVIASGSLNSPISFFCKGILVNGTQQPGQPRSDVTVTQGRLLVQTRSRQ
ncbi:MAG: tyrosinase family protein [Candidatus Sulfotelmatobacter sp.]